MGAATPLTAGDHFARLTIVGRAGHAASPSGTVRRLYSCLCECGGTVVVRENSLKNGNTKSCGCLQRERTSAANYKHGHRYSKQNSGNKTSAYMQWQSMRRRCESPANKDFCNYGARGIFVCEAWKDFQVFYADMGARPAGMQLDRIDNNGPYSKENCRWVTASDQANNRRSTVLLEFEGQVKPLAVWAQERGITRDCLYQRLFKSQWPIERALNQGAK